MARAVRGARAWTAPLGGLTLVALLAAFAPAAGCASRSAGASFLPSLGPVMEMTFDSSTFLAVPFPGQAYLERDEPLEGFPIGNPRCQVEALLGMAKAELRSSGFSRTSGVYFRIGALFPPRLAVDPSPARTMRPDSPVLLMDVDPATTGFLPNPVEVGLIDGNTLLVLEPLTGFPLAARHLHAAGVWRGAFAAGNAERSPDMTALVGGQQPAGMSDAVFATYVTAFKRLKDAGIDTADLLALTTFRTGDPVAEMRRARATVLRDEAAGPTAHVPACAAEGSLVRWPSAHPARALDGIHGLALDPCATRQDAAYCTFSTRMAMPVYQGGTIPYRTGGGQWVTGPDGGLALQCVDDARVVLTVPRGPMPPDGFPLVLFVRAGAGGRYDPMIDREPGSQDPGNDTRDLDQCKVQVSGGPARFFARAGFAGLSIDGPHTGIRTRTEGLVLTGEDGDIFNILNVVAIRDNIRQSALEVVLAANLAGTIALADPTCKGLDLGGKPFRIDPHRIVLFSHSMGSTIAPLALAVEPALRAAILSGAGGSYVDSVLHKLRPMNLSQVFEPFATVLPLTHFDPVLNLFQWALEPSDFPVYGAHIVHGGPGMERDVLMIQGITDHYVGVPMANAASVSMRLDLAGPERDTDGPSPLGPPLDALFGLSGRSGIALPAQGNQGGATAVVSQQHRYAGGVVDDDEEGHEVVFEEDRPRYMLRCFLESWARGAGRVPDASRVVDPLRDPCAPAGAR